MRIFKILNALFCLEKFRFRFSFLVIESEENLREKDRMLLISLKRANGEREQNTYSECKEKCGWIFFF